MRRNTVYMTVVVALAIPILGYAAWKGDAGESERRVKEAEVPPAALQALKKLAAGAKITEFTEEIEHGHTYYEASWTGEHGKVDGLVTAAGDAVEIEEQISEQAVPRAVIDKARQMAGKDVSLYCEKKTVFLYEVKFRKGDHRHEIVFSPDGREHEHDEETGKEEGDE